MDKRSRIKKRDYSSLQSAIMEYPDDLTLKFLLAVSQLNLKMVKLCLDQGVNSNVVFQDQSALHVAAENGQVEMLRLLLTYPETNPDLTDNFGLTPLHLAIRYKYTDMVVLLLMYNADVNKADMFQSTPLHFAVLKDYGIAAILLENGANPNCLDAFGHTPLYLAANVKCDQHTVEKLFQHKADANLYSPKHTMTLLMECCLACNTSERLVIIKILLANGAKVNDIYPATKRTAVHIAAFTGNANLAKLLLKTGGKINLRDNRGKLPFQIAREQNHKIVERILKPNVIFIQKNNKK